MRIAPRVVRFCVCSLAALTATGCCHGPRYALRNSQHRALALHQENQMLLGQLDETSQMAAVEAARAAQLAQETAGLQMGMQSMAQSLSERDQILAGKDQQLASLSQELGTANQRVANYQATQAELEERLVMMINQQKQSTSPLSDEASRRFEELARKYPNFEFDPLTGISKFHSDILFSSGSAQLKRSSEPLLREFAAIMNDGVAQNLNILIVGHTDDVPIARPGTREQHPTNGHLSTNRGHAVRVALQQSGLTDGRMGVAGYGPHQPVARNNSDETRQLNRRVEIFVLAPDAVVAGWDPLDQSRN